MTQKPTPVISSSSSDDDLKDERLEERSSVLRAADIILGEGRPTIACLVKDSSESGFRLLVDTPLTLPDRFQLVLSHPLEQYVCRLIWENDGEIGVQLLD